MNTPSPLERRAAELGLSQEDATPSQRVKSPVATADKMLLGLGCCALAAVSAAISVWMVVPTLIATGAASALLVRYLNATNAMPHRPAMAPTLQLREEAVRQMMEEEEERSSNWNRNASLNPMFRTSLSNISYDDHYRS